MSALPERALFDRLLREDLGAFIAKAFQVVSPADRYRPNWHIEVIADHLMRCYRGEIRRLIITMPPRSLKSICASTAFPAWVLGRDPAKRIICASYAAELAAKLARDCRAVMESDWYARVFPATRLARSAELDLETTRKGVRFATSVGGTLTGRGGNIVIIDDPLKPQEALSAARRQAVTQWYDGTLYSRLDDKANDSIILVMQRLHVEDLVAHVLEKEPWVHLDLPAIAEAPQSFVLSDGRRFDRAAGDLLHPAREPDYVLKAVERTIGSFNFSAQYQQRPAPEQGNLLKWPWFQLYDEAPSLRPRDRVVQSWDTASKGTEYADYSVCTTWHVQGDDYYLLDVFRERLDYPALRDAVLALGARFKANTILVEDTAAGTALVQDIRHQHIVGFPKPIPVTPKGDKVMRVSTQSAKIEAGHVHVPRRAPWLEAFRQEILAFPHVGHDDQVDSLSQFLTWFDERARYTYSRGKFGHGARRF